jgi:hypothetical protein
VRVLRPAVDRRHLLNAELGRLLAMKRKPDDDNNWKIMMAVGFKVGPKWVTVHLGGAYGPEICRVKRSLVLAREDDEIPEWFWHLSQSMMVRAIKAEKKAMAKVPKPPLRKR